MYRKYEAELDSWFKKNGRKPLIIRGARQVGKSTLVRQFAQNQGLKLYEINMEKQTELESVFATRKIDKVIDAIEDIFQEKIQPNSKSILFLDELQAAPSSIPCLRYFYEEMPELPVICAGSLLEFTLNDHKYSMPVGRVEFLYMGPMDFFEFLIAKKDQYFINKISKYKFNGELSDQLHQKGLQLLREYLFVGGMPEAIKSSIAAGIDSVPAIHAQILQTYQADFVKYTRKNHLNKIQKVFRYIFMNPCQKIKYVNISRDDISRDLKENLQLLIQARVATPVYHSSCAGLPLEANENEDVFKILALDVGLMNHAQGLKWNSFKNYDEYEIVTEGVIAEQFIGQHLLFSKNSYLEPRLNYWLREGKSTNAEVDFIIEKNGQMTAIEVKAGSAGKIRSLHQWMKDIKYKKKSAIRFNFSKGGTEKVAHLIDEKKVEYSLLTIPLYAIPWWIQNNN